MKNGEVQPQTPMWSQRLMWVAWPAFLGACVLEVLVFSMVDPQVLHWMDQPLTGSRQAIYTMAFFVFWLTLAATCALTAFLAQPVDGPVEAALNGTAED